MNENAVLKIKEKKYQLPIIVGSEGEHAVDISNLRSQSGFVSYDPSYGNTGATTSKITYLDGEGGILRYRGYSIEDLCEHCSFIEVAYLIIYG